MRALPQSARLDLLLVLAALGLGGYLTATSGAPTSSEINARSRNVFPAFEPETIQEIRLISPEATVLLKRDIQNPDPELYFLGESSSLAAAPEPVSELLSALDFATWIRRLPPTQSSNLKKLGFESPQLELRVQAGPRSARLLLGTEAPHPEGSIYARFEATGQESVTGVISASLLAQLLRREQEFRGSSLFAYSRSDTSVLKVSTEQSQLTLKADGLGFLVAPAQAQGTPPLRANSALVELIFYQLASAKLSPFLDEGTAKAAVLADPERLIIQQQANERPDVEVHVGGDCPDDPHSTVAWRTKPNLVTGCVPRSLRTTLGIAPSTLIDRTACPLAADEIDHVIIKRNDLGSKHKLDLIRRDAAFVLLSRDSQEVELQPGQELLEVLSSGVLGLLEERPEHTKEIGSLTMKGQSQATGAISQYAPQGSDARAAEPHLDPLVQELHLEIYHAEVEGASRLVVHRLDDGAWLTVPSELAWAFASDDYWAQSRKLSHWESDDILSLSIKSPSLEQTLHQEHDALTLQRPGSAPEPADSALARVLLEEFERFEALRFEAAWLDTASHPRKNAELVVEFRLRGEEEAQRMWIGQRTRGGYLAESTFHDSIFVISPAMKRLLETPLASRSALRFDSQRIESLILDADGRHYSFERRAGELSPSGGAAVREMVPALEETISRIEVVARRAITSPNLARKQSRLTMTITLENSETRIVHIGSSTEWQGQSVMSAWIDGVNGEYLLTRASAEALLDLI